MASDVKEENSECSWKVDEENEEKYNFSDEKGLWEPKPEDILSMFEQLAKGGALPLQWSCPGRRPPESEPLETTKEDSGMEVDMEEKREEETREPEPCAFDFDDTPSESTLKTTPIRTLGGPGRTPRTEKRVARMDNIMDSLLKQQMQRNAEREARRAKASPARNAQGRGRLLKFGAGSPLAQSPMDFDAFVTKASPAPVAKITAATTSTSTNGSSKMEPSAVAAISDSSASVSTTESKTATTTTGSGSVTVTPSQENSLKSNAASHEHLSETNYTENSINISEAVVSTSAPNIVDNVSFSVPSSTPMSVQPSPSLQDADTPKVFADSKAVTGPSSDTSSTVNEPDNHNAVSIASATSSSSPPFPPPISSHPQQLPPTSESSVQHSDSLSSTLPPPSPPSVTGHTSVPVAVSDSASIVTSSVAPEVLSSTVTNPSPLPTMAVPSSVGNPPPPSTVALSLSVTNPPPPSTVALSLSVTNPPPESNVAVPPSATNPPPPSTVTVPLSIVSPPPPSTVAVSSDGPQTATTTTSSHTDQEKSATMISEPMCSSVLEPISTSISESISTSISESISTSVSEPMSTSESELISTSVSEPISTLVSEPMSVNGNNDGVTKDSS